MSPIGPRFTRRDELLRAQAAETGSGLDRPHPISVEWFGPRQQTFGLPGAGREREAGDGLFVAVDRDSSMGRRVRVDPDGHGHAVLLVLVDVGPRRALLM